MKQRESEDTHGELLPKTTTSAKKAAMWSCTTLMSLWTVRKSAKQPNLDIKIQTWLLSILLLSFSSVTLKIRQNTTDQVDFTAQESIWKPISYWGKRASWWGKESLVSIWVKQWLKVSHDSSSKANSSKAQVNQEGHKDHTFEIKT